MRPAVTCKRCLTEESSAAKRMRNCAALEVGPGGDEPQAASVRAKTQPWHAAHHAHGAQPPIIASVRAPQAPKQCKQPKARTTGPAGSRRIPRPTATS